MTVTRESEALHASRKIEIQGRIIRAQGIQIDRLRRACRRTYAELILATVGGAMLGITLALVVASWQR